MVFNFSTDIAAAALQRLATDVAACDAGDAKQYNFARAAARLGVTGGALSRWRSSDRAMPIIALLDLAGAKETPGDVAAEYYGKIASWPHTAENLLAYQAAGLKLAKLADLCRDAALQLAASVAAADTDAAHARRQLDLLKSEG
jgi:hypothetical protein